jgi:hypothetical protein
LARRHSTSNRRPDGQAKVPRNYTPPLRASELRCWDSPPSAVLLTRPPVPVFPPLLLRYSGLPPGPATQVQRLGPQLSTSSKQAAAHRPALTCIEPGQFRSTTASHSHDTTAVSYGASAASPAQLVPVLPLGLGLARQEYFAHPPSSCTSLARPPASTHATRGRYSQSSLQASHAERQSARKKAGGHHGTTSTQILAHTHAPHPHPAHTYTHPHHTTRPPNWGLPDLPPSIQVPGLPCPPAGAKAAPACLKTYSLKHLLFQSFLISPALLLPFNPTSLLPSSSSHLPSSIHFLEACPS